MSYKKRAAFSSPFLEFTWRIYAFSSSIVTKTATLPGGLLTAHSSYAERSQKRGLHAEGAWPRYSVTCHSAHDGRDDIP
jgi:hypothetical protein